jgi:cytochrome c556
MSQVGKIASYTRLFRRLQTMRTFHWIFLLILPIFLGSAVMAQAPAPTATGPAAPCATPLHPAIKQPTAKGATPLTGMAPKVPIKDIMNSMIVPSSTVVFGAVATTTDATGVHESKPETDDDWNTVFANAVMLTEAANVLMVPGRQRCLGGAIPAANRADFLEKARELVEAGTEAVVAAQKHDVDGISSAGERLDVACDKCHEVYQLTEDDPNVGKVLGTYKPKVAPKVAPNVAPKVAPSK